MARGGIAASAATTTSPSPRCSATRATTRLWRANGIWASALRPWSGDSRISTGFSPEPRTTGIRRGSAAFRPRRRPGAMPKGRSTPRRPSPTTPSTSPVRHANGTRRFSSSSPTMRPISRCRLPKSGSSDTSSATRRDGMRSAKSASHGCARWQYYLRRRRRRRAARWCGVPSATARTPYPHGIRSPRNSSATSRAAWPSMRRWWRSWTSRSGACSRRSKRTDSWSIRS